MSQDNQDNQNRDQQDRQGQGSEQPQGWENDRQASDDMTREGRADQPETEPVQGGSSPDRTQAADDLDDMDEDRDEDLRDDGSPNRRNNIG